MIPRLMQRLGLAAAPAQATPLDRFLRGTSISTLAADAGRDARHEQRRIETDIRNYVVTLQAEIEELQAENAALRQGK